MIMREGRDASILACGPLLYEALKAAEELQKKNISIEVLNVATIKPLDTETILKSVAKTKRVITVEEGQAFGGLGGAVVEYLSQVMPVPVRRIGVQDRFGQSGTIDQLWAEYQLDASTIIKQAMALVKEK
jgi:transketolase